MRNSWIISFAAVCGVGAFVYTLATGTVRSRAGWSGGRGGPINTMASTSTRSMQPLPESIEELEEMAARNRREDGVRNSGRVQFKLARRYEEEGRAADAARMWEEAGELRREMVERNPDRPDLWFEAGWALWKSGKKEQAVEAMEMAERLYAATYHGNRTFWEWHRLGWARQILGQEQEALIAWARARDSAQATVPGWDAEGLYSLACAHALLGDRPAAMATLERAVVAGWDNAARASHDPDLESIRGDAGFGDLLEKMRRERQKSGEG